MKSFGWLKSSMLAVVWLTAISGGQADAGTLTYNGSIITGATGVNVGGTLYDVELLPGNCQAVFSGCVQGALQFNTFDTARDAMVELVKLLPTGVRPKSIQGCDSFAFDVLCYIDTPWAANVGGYAAATVSITNVVSGVFGGGASGVVDNPQNSLARWSLTPVPVPAALPLFATGIAAVGYAARRRKNVAA